MKYLLKKLLASLFFSLCIIKYSFSICSDSTTCYDSIDTKIKETNSSLFSDNNQPTVTSSYARFIAFWNIYFSNVLQFTLTGNFSYPQTPYIQAYAYKTLNIAEKEAINSSGNLIQNAIDFLVSDQVEVYASNLVNDLSSVITGSNPNLNSSLNIDAFITPTAFNATDITSVSGINFTKIICNLISPLAIKYSSSSQTAPSSMSTEDRNKQLNTRWELISKQSICLSNFYYPLTARMIQADIGNNIQISPSYPLDSNSSFQRANEYQHTRRVSTADWTGALEGATDLLNKKDYLFTLAEVYSKIYNKIKINEKYLTALSAFQIQHADILKELQKISDQQQSSSTNTTPTPNTDGGGQSNPTPNSGGGSSSPPSSSQSPGTASFCFVATSIYGSNSLQVKTLKFYRDLRLKNDILSLFLVESYYLFSPDIISLLESNTSLKKIVTIFLDQIVREINEISFSVS